MFLSLTNIRYCYYKETEKILGNTYGMCILQDFEAITPNLLARTIETVEGGGLVILLLKTMTSLKQLYTMNMDVHARYRTEAHGDVVARFNERFILSLADCKSCLVIDDEMNVLPISGGKNVKELPPVADEDKELAAHKKELLEVKESLKEVEPAGSLVGLTKTVDQAKAVLEFIDAIAEKTLKSTVTLTAGRGRGKSAALGIAVAAAVAHGYSNIFITSPSPENLKTLFEFIFKGFDALGYADHLDYDIIQSTNPAFNKAIVRVNVHRQHRQTIQYIQPQDAHVLGQAELVVIDEAAAIPLPLVKKLMGPYLVFMASTINGYEGTGRSLSLKLIQQLREQSRGGVKAIENGEVTDRSGKVAKSDTVGSHVGRTLRETTLSEPIRYAPGDEVEKWLNKLLCLDATLPKRTITGSLPAPDSCQLYSVSRDTLFSYHPVPEKFLQKMMALFVSSHYKNSPNDLQLMSDAPSHRLFVLLPPTAENDNHVPDPLVAIQVSLEGQISKESVLNALGRGKREGGDMLPWLISQQFQDPEFASLSGARIVRIATVPEYSKMGYGSQALNLLTEFYEGKFANLDEEGYIADEIERRVTDEELESGSLTDELTYRQPKSMPPLLLAMKQKRPELLDYMGVSYGLTDPLHRFWRKSGFSPVYLRQTKTELTGEHSCAMLKVLEGKSNVWLGDFVKDFHTRFLSLLPSAFRHFPTQSALVMASCLDKAPAPRNPTPPLNKDLLQAYFTPHDGRRLDAYADNTVDYHLIADLLPRLCTLYFTGALPSISLNPLQKMVLLGLGAQMKTIDDIAAETNLPASQLLAILLKIIRKFSVQFRAILAEEIVKSLPAPPEDDTNADGDFLPTELPDRINRSGAAEMESETREAGKTFVEELGMKEAARELVGQLDLRKYEIGEDVDFGEAEEAVKRGAKTVGVKKIKKVEKSEKEGGKERKRKGGEDGGEKKKRKKENK